MKQCQDNPWEKFSSDFAPGQEIEGEVRNVTEFGLFVGLTEEIDGMVKDAEEKSEEDKKRHELVESRNKLDELIYRTDKSFKEFKDKLSDDEKKELEEALEQGRNTVKGEDAEGIKEASDKITQASHKLAELMYKQQAESSGAGDGAGHEHDGTTEEPQAEEASDDKKDGDDVIDAEFTEK